MDKERIVKMALASGLEFKLLDDGTMGFRPYIYKFADMIESAVSHSFAKDVTPKKVYELIYDYGDGYTTIFIADNKQSALEFIELVRDADQNFIKGYGFDDDTDELLIEQYEDKHPLKPYAKGIFNLMYEDSFSEYVCKYPNHTFSSELSIIEHELWTGVKNES